MILYTYYMLILHRSPGGAKRVRQVGLSIVSRGEAPPLMTPCNIRYIYIYTTFNKRGFICRFAELGVIENHLHIIKMRGAFAKITSIT